MSVLQRSAPWPSDGPRAPPVALTVGLLVLLALPTVIWVARRSWAKRDTGPKDPHAPPKHRWWQP